MEIRKAEESDSLILESIFSSLYKPQTKWSESRIGEKMREGREYYLLEGKGAIELVFDGNECELVAIAVNPVKKGYGSKLLKFSEELAKERNCSRIWCHTLDIYGAKGFYTRKEWKESEFIPKFFDGLNCFKFSKSLH